MMHDIQKKLIFGEKLSGAQRIETFFLKLYLLYHERFSHEKFISNDYDISIVEKPSKVIIVIFLLRLDN